MAGRTRTCFVAEPLAPSAPRSSALPCPAPGCLSRRRVPCLRCRGHEWHRLIVPQASPGTDAFNRPAGQYVSTQGSDSMPAPSRRRGGRSSTRLTSQRASSTCAAAAIRVRGQTFRSDLRGYPAKRRSFTGYERHRPQYVTSATFRDLIVTGAVGRRGPVSSSTRTRTSSSHNVIYNNVNYGIRTWYSTRHDQQEQRDQEEIEGIRIS